MCHLETRTMSLTPKPMLSHRDGYMRRSLNLDEYKKRKGLIQVAQTYNIFSQVEMQPVTG